MKLVYRQIIKELLGLFVMILGVFLSLLLLGKLLKLRELLFTIDLSSFDLFVLFAYLSPFFLMLLIPIACMLSIFLVFQRMSADREIVALRAGGVSLAQILPAALFFLCLCTFSNALISFYGVSWGMENFQGKLLNMAKNKAQVSIRPGVFNREFPGLTIYSREVEKESNKMKGIFVQDSTHRDAHVYMIAPQGRIKTDQEKGLIYFHLARGKIYHSYQNQTNILTFSSYDLVLDMHELLGQVDMDKDDPQKMSLQELAQRIQAKKAAAGDKMQYTELLLEYQKRFALPMACLILGFIAFPLAWMFEGVKRHYGAVVILLLFFFYYALFYLGLGVGESGKFNPSFSVWLANVVFFLLGCFLFYLALKEKTRFFGK